MKDWQRQMLAVLILDLGYRHDDRPLYGGAPIRHQIAWELATEGVDLDYLATLIGDMLRNNQADAERAAQARNDREALA